ncbi:4'-phosphopantetheinyl transferase family protein [Sinanaerobacter sp. ZZT-01]|uniref:4'-phosphopantetheinyl transferase family protein n=1 Tax=Sinanaerobacter sp. ZZT-01 TaxID=3111540 RepID=UPI002D792CEA|nr:4'-phosphopantetheinyl transferase superfamily protein [Sinanaerobacter sp. ZZT-01]WRR93485.1 4'-phosphopantetheinyl transferase superfamily protein [Sinanaerobacter sp. ZZT-01]
MYLYYRENKNQEESQGLLKEALRKHARKKGLQEFLQSEICVSKGIHGKPYIEQPCMDNLHFSISHTGIYWVCLIDGGEVGVDIENKTRNLSEARILNIARRFFSEEELNAVKKQGKETFYQIWVRKEAFIKCKGTGLSENLKSFSAIDEDGNYKKTIKGLWVQSLPLPIPVYGAYCSALKEAQIQHIENF